MEEVIENTRAGEGVEFWSPETAWATESCALRPRSLAGEEQRPPSAAEMTLCSFISSSSKKV